MKTDSLFYRLFQNFPSLLFELIDLSIPETESYQFQSVEIKQTAFRLDGVFVPPETEPTLPIFFVEVQFQAEDQFYSRLFSEIWLYLRQYPVSNPWRAVVIYPSRSVDVGETHHYQELLESERVSRIYLDELAKNPDPISLGLVQLVVAAPSVAIHQAIALVKRTKQEINDQLTQRQILDLVETIIVYKLPQLSREEIETMLGFTEIDIKQTRFYQDVYAEGEQAGKLEGRQEGEIALILRQLNRRFGQLPIDLIEQIESLNISELEALGEALLDFVNLADLPTWLQAQKRDRLS